MMYVFQPSPWNISTLRLFAVFEWFEIIYVRFYVIATWQVILSYRGAVLLLLFFEIYSLS
jgi:hypothetical protein